MALQIKKLIQFQKIHVRCMSKVTYDYQYMQNSKIPTMHFQKSLPRLPIPELSKTCDRYLAAQQPILSSEGFNTTEKLVRDFEKSEGKKLHDMLKEKDRRNKGTSYISEPWSDMYLSDRTPLPINYNPVIIFQNDTKREYNDQLLKATNLLISSLRFMKSLRKNILAPEVFHLNPKKSDNETFRTVTSMCPSIVSWYAAYMFNAYPLDMSQYNKLFNSTRVPMIGKDQIRQNTEAKHVVVLRNGNFYTFDVLDDANNILPAGTLLGRLKHVLEAREPIASVPLGAMTTENRNTWAEVRAHMVKDQQNKTALDKIDSALFSIVLDEEDVGTEPNPKMIRHFLHGEGKNSWFDKSFSLIVTKNGTAGVNFEHSWGDGVAVLRYLQDIYHDSISNPQVHPDTECQSDNQILKLNFNLDDKIKTSVETAIKKYNSICDSLDLNFFIIEGIGKNLCKKYSLSPDSVMQLGFQAAFHRQNKSFVPTYESCSTAAFKHGRTEAIRPCTAATSQYCVKATNNSTPRDLLPLIVNASNVHKTLTKDAAMGQGFDRHLYALKLIAEENKMATPPIFDDEAYKSINKNILSSSTLSSAAIQGGCFGPVVDNGYGIAYMIMDDKLGAVVTNYRDHRDGPDFVSCMKNSFEQLRNVLIVPK